MDESVDYLRGKVAALQLASNTCANLMLRGMGTSDDINARIRIVNSVRAIIEEGLKAFPMASGDLYREGFHDALTEFSTKLIDGVLE